MFERTHLGNRTRFFHPNGTSMQRLEEGFSYFEEWAIEIEKNKGFETGVDCKQFMSWQVCVHMYISVHST